MAENPDNFVPYSSPMGIPGSSYMAQVGKVGDLWALRLVKGKDVLEMGTFDELNGNKMIAFIIQSVAIPMINPYQISQSVKALIRQAERGPLTAPAQPAAAATSAGNVEIEGEMAAAPTIATGSDNACPRCRRPIQANFFFCPYCSQKLREFRCVACKKEIRLDYKMCPYCGSVIGS
jgi:RNA polymerase subunit RPABC4/transcription elongation factor Spt4